MKYLSYITGILNDQINTMFDVDRKRVLGLAQAVRIENGQGNIPKPKLVPGIYKGSGEVEYCGVDDKFDFTSYHKALNTSSTILPGGFGIERNVQMTHNMALVIAANVDKICMTADQLALTLQFAFLGIRDNVTIPKDLIQRMTIRVNSILLNPEQVFREEYTNETYFIGPEIALIKCLYSVESVLNSRCFKAKCETLNN